MQKKFTLFLIVFLALSAFMAGYLFVSGGLQKGTGNQTGTVLSRFNAADKTEKEQPKDESFFPLSDTKSVSPAISSGKNGVIYFEKESGKILEYSFSDKKESVISGNQLPNFLSAIWSPTKREVVQFFYLNSGTELKYFNLNTLKATGLESGSSSPVFSPDGNLIAYYLAGSDTASGKIIIIQPEGAYKKTLLNTRIEEVELQWPSKDYIVVTTDSGVFLLSEDGKLNKLFEPVPFFEQKWSLGGKKVLYSSVDVYSEISLPFLAVKDPETKKENNLKIAGNASKCVWSADDKHIFCALYESPSADKIYKINIETGSKTIISEPEIIVKDILLSVFEDYIIILSNNDMLYGIKIPE